MKNNILTILSQSYCIILQTNKNKPSYNMAKL